MGLLKLMSDKPTRAIIKELEATYFLVPKKQSISTVGATVAAIALVAGVAGWMAAESVHSNTATRQSFYQPDASPPIGERLKHGPALVRSGGILLLSDSGECPMGSVQLSDVAIEVIKQRAEQFAITGRSTASGTSWHGRTYKTCKI